MIFFKIKLQTQQPVDQMLSLLKHGLSVTQSQTPPEVIQLTSAAERRRSNRTQQFVFDSANSVVVMQGDSRKSISS